jgi:hypothetical protein
MAVMNKLLLFIVPFLLFTSCKKVEEEDNDPCASIACVNGKLVTSDITETCNCDCFYGFGGDDCELDIAPTKVYLNSIELLSWPSNSSLGDNWDSGFGSGTNPDLFIKVTGAELSYVHPTYYDNQPNGTTVNFILDDPIEIDSTITNHYVRLFDFDEPDPVLGIPNEPDIMGSVPFSPFQETYSNPHTMIVENGELSFRLGLSYVW